MKVLVACEESQAVCKAFRARGHEAYSCDLMEPSGGHPEWHILGDCLQAIMGGQIVTMDGLSYEIARWDMIIAFVPCTKTSNAGARHLYKGGRLNLSRYYEGLCGKALFLAVWAADCEKVIIENPTPSKIFDYPTPTQAIQPWQFGHPFTKKTLLWERGVPPPTPNRCCRADCNMVSERQLQSQARDSTQRNVYHRPCKNASQNIPRCGKSHVRAMGLIER